VRDSNPESVILPKPSRCCASQDQRQVRKRLCEVADLASQLRVILLGEKRKMITEGKQALEEFLGLGYAASEGIVVGQPESAREKCPF
jgi:hypothetical protein